MDIQKEREAFERLPLAELAIKCEYVYYNEKTNSYWPNGDFCPSDAPETINFAWQSWQAAKAQAVQEWISVEDSLPNRQVNVLVASKHNFVCIASLTNNHKNNKFYDGDSLAINSITHWMPLPKPPKSTGASQ